MALTYIDDSDDPILVGQVDRIVSAIADRYQPNQLRIFRIENWFDSKWLQFAGKTLGALGIWDRKHVIIPPFVQNRLTASSLFERNKASNTYLYAGEGPQIHHDGSSGDNLNRRAKRFAPNAALFWFSSNSAKNARASLMAYIPLPDKTYWGFFIAFERSPQWHPTELINIDRKELQLFQTTPSLPISLPVPT